MSSFFFLKCFVLFFGDVLKMLNEKLDFPYFVQDEKREIVGSESEAYAIADMMQVSCF